MKHSNIREGIMVGGQLLSPQPYSSAVYSSRKSNQSSGKYQTSVGTCYMCMSCGQRAYLKFAHHHKQGDSFVISCSSCNRVDILEGR